MKKLPFKQHRVGGTLIREFRQDVNSSELTWHRDREDRLVVVREGTGWMLQIENRLPEPLSEGSSHFIPKNTYHRIIKGTTGLVVEITEDNAALRACVRELLSESKKSDAFEALVAETIQEVGAGQYTTRVGGDVKYSDVEVTSAQGGKTWVEVKMGHRDNLANPRISFDGSVWTSSSSSPVAIAMIDLATNSPEVNAFMNELKTFMGLSSQDVIKIPSTKGGLKDPQAVPLETMREFVESRGNRYLTKQTGLDIGSLVTQHYLQGKAEPAHYMQAGDDFYLIGGADPLKLQQNVKIPVLGGTGTFHIRVGTRSEYYEIQPEVKITAFTPPTSPVSALGGVRSDKPNPFKK